MLQGRPPIERAAGEAARQRAPSALEGDWPVAEGDVESPSPTVTSHSKAFAAAFVAADAKLQPLAVRVGPQAQQPSAGEDSARTRSSASSFGDPVTAAEISAGIATKDDANGQPTPPSQRRDPAVFDLDADDSEADPASRKPSGFDTFDVFNGSAPPDSPPSPDHADGFHPAPPPPGTFDPFVDIPSKPVSPAAEVAPIAASRPPGAPELSVAEMRSAISEALAASGVDADGQIAEAVELLTGSSVVVAVGGPTKSGKSTLVNALFGRLVVPSGALPNTFLPIAFGAGGAEAGKLEVRLAGEGLARLMLGNEACADADGRPLDARRAYMVVDRVNQAVRAHIEGLEDYGDFLRDFSDLGVWHLEIRTLTDRKFTLVDLPGGSEAGPPGHAIQTFLQRQVERATLLLFVVMATNVSPLGHSAQVRSFLGGTVPRKPAMILLNAIEKAEVREGAQAFVEGNRPFREALAPLHLLDTFYISARVSLAAKLLEYMTAQSPDGKTLPATTDPGAAELRLELETMYEAIYPAGNFEEEYDDDRDRLPRKIKQAYEREYSMNKDFQQRFEQYLQEDWPKTLCKIIATQAHRAAEEQLQKLESEAEFACKTVAEASVEQHRFQALLRPERIDVLRQHVLERLNDSPTVLACRNRFRRACELLGTSHPQADLTVENISETMNDRIGTAWMVNVHQFDGIRPEFKSYFPTRGRAEAFAAAFRDWCAAEGAEAASGATALEVVRRWLAKELGREVGTLGLEAAAGPRGAAMPQLGEPVLPRGIGAALLERVFVAPFILAPAVLAAPFDRGASVRLAGCAAVGHEAFRMNGDLRDLWPRIAREVLDAALEARAMLAKRTAMEVLSRNMAKALRRAEGGQDDQDRARQAAAVARVAVEKMRLLIPTS